ncbi:MAG: DUF3883 domain-containing protein [Burkholderiales bacterium]|nr:DUF3883 domain-containing protein [Burkholderiales bacterium]
MYWVYKCNSKNRSYQRTSGDWADVFESQEPQSWGTTDILPELSKAKAGDTILAYQTDRNELVGVAKVVGWKPQGKFKSLILKPIRTIGVRVRPLKKADSKVARIPALQQGPIRTLYAISRADAATLLKAAGVHMALAAKVSEHGAEEAAKGGGFGTPETNKRVEKAAMRHVMRHYKSLGWSVKDVSSQNRGYDLLCKKSGEERHVEVKGASGEGQQFILTAKELKAWSTDKRFVLAFVGNSLSAQPSISFFPRAKSQAEFSIRALSFIATRQPKPMPNLGARKKRARRLA